MLPTADAFDQGAEAVWEARARGEKLMKPDLARIFRTTFQAYQISNPPQAAVLPNTKRTRARNPLFDALAEATGSNPENLTKTGGRTIGNALAEIAEAYPGLTVEDIHQTALTYKRNHRDWPLTPMALSKHWAECFSGGSERTKSAKKDPYLEPPHWKPTALRMYPGSEVSGMEWLKIPITIRADILRQIL